MPKESEATGLQHSWNNNSNNNSSWNCACIQVSGEVCRAFSLCRQGRSTELLTHYQSTPCPPLPPVQRDKQSSANAAAAAAGDDDSSDDEPESSQVWCSVYFVLILVLILNPVPSVLWSVWYKQPNSIYSTKIKNRIKGALIIIIGVSPLVCIYQKFLRCVF